MPFSFHTVAIRVLSGKEHLIQGVPRPWQLDETTSPKPKTLSGAPSIETSPPKEITPGAWRHELLQPACRVLKIPNPHSPSELGTPNSAPRTPVAQEALQDIQEQVRAAPEAHGPGLGSRRQGRRHFSECECVCVCDMVTRMLGCAHCSTDYAKRQSQNACLFVCSFWFP